MWISTRVRVAGAGLATVALMTVGSLIAQEVTTPKSSSKSDSPAAVRRVPSYFGQVGLTPEQKEAVYKIQGKHQAKIDELEKQIDEIQAQMLGECEGVLTDTQKQMLAQRRKAAASKKGQDPEKAGKGMNKSGG